MFYGKHAISKCDPEIKKTLLLKVVITTSHIFTVGPLDFCGIAQRMSAQGNGKEMSVVLSQLAIQIIFMTHFIFRIVICDGNPLLSPFYAQKHALSPATKGVHHQGEKHKTIAQLPDNRKKGLSSLQFNAKKEKVYDDSPPTKRRRVTVDRAVVANTPSDLIWQPRTLQSRN